MRSIAKTPQEYIDSLPEDRRETISRLRNLIIEKLPKGFEEQMHYGMLCYVVPLSTYPDGYHCDPKKLLCLSSAWLPKRISSLYITWEFMQFQS